MISFQNILPAIADFLKAAQELGIIKEFVLNYSEINDTLNSSEANKILSKFVESVNEAVSTARSTEETDMQADIQITDVESIEVRDEDDPPVDKSLIQIQVDEDEVKRRIMAFTSRKRKEVDEWNVQEFCNRPYVEEQNPAWEEINTCARVDAVFIPRCGSKSHVKVSKVENRWGPQTHPHLEKKIKEEPNSEDYNLQNDATLQAIEERLNSMEFHLKIKTDDNLRKDIFQRLKELEDRIIFLEGISTDYFHLSDTDYPSPRKRNHSEMEKPYSSWSFDEVQKRIQSLKEALVLKAKVKTERSE